MKHWQHFLPAQYSFELLVVIVVEGQLKATSIRLITSLTEGAIVLVVGNVSPVNSIPGYIPAHSENTPAIALLLPRPKNLPVLPYSIH